MDKENILFSVLIAIGIAIAVGLFTNRLYSTRPLEKYKLSDGTIVMCKHLDTRLNRANLSGCEDGKEYFNLTNLQKEKMNAPE